MATSDIVIRGAREHNLRDISLDLPARRVDLLDRRLGLGQELARLRHALCRRAKALRREPLELRPPVPGPDAQARGRSDRRALPLDLDPAEDRRAQPAVHRGHDHRDQRLSPRPFARVGQGHCPQCDRPVAAQTREQIVARILELPAGTAFSVLAPVIRGQKGEYKDLFADLSRAGYVRARVNGQVDNLSDNLALDRQIKHNIEVVIDRLKAGPGSPDPAGRGGRGGAQAGRGDGDRRRRGAARPAPVVALRLHVLRAELRPAQPAALQLQQPAGDVPGMRRPGRAARLRPRPARSRPVALGLGRGDRAARAGQGDRASGGGTSSRAWRPTSRPTPTARPRGPCSRAPGATSTRSSHASGCTAPATG